MLPLIFELSKININLDIRSLSPYLIIFVAVLLISKIPTFSFKKISISPKLTVFILFGIGVVFVSFVFFTFETLLITGLIYFATIPISFFIYKRNGKKVKSLSTEDEHEDVL